MENRFQPFSDYLTGQPRETMSLTLTIAEIEGMLAAPLSAIAWTQAWWRNERPRSHARAWLDAGWRVETVSLRIALPNVTFARQIEGAAS